MEPIRPDEDELRSRMAAEAVSRPARASDKGDRARGEANKAKAPAKKEKPAEAKPGGARAVTWLAILLLAFVGVGGFLGYQQEQRIEALEGQLEEADYWARQSKLALARFEGALSEAGESLEETGASMGERLDTVDSEIRKLWVLANERNRQQLDQHQTSLETVQSSIAALQAGQAEQGEQLGGMVGRIDAQGERLGEDVAGLGQRIDTQAEQLAERLAEVSGRFDLVDEQIDRRLQRFVQERRLADEEVASRLASLERRMDQQAGAAELAQVREQLADIEQTVKAIDASRAQLTSRLVGLSEEVDRLRQETRAQ
ncbi:hypothetical protein [Marinobacter mobilis]|uniref:Chromosome partition protein Smc n=1 Tax=Marinobacter mobilis TaxID=488533 RepID=A0A1H3DEP7_9GAMM|nr:hypothetical protein [Marinobacter mobilis]SDX64800.1 hypothetical protein SAMN04487960_11255 [Marinobacter mobilis]